MPRPVALPRALVAAAATAILLAACGGTDDGPSSAPTTTEPTTTLSPEARDEAEVRQLIEDWHERSDAIYEGRAEVSELSDYLTGTFLEQIQQRVDDARSSGETFEADPGARRVIESIEVDAPDAEVDLCVFDSGTYRSAEGEVTDEVSRTFRLVTTAERTDDGWRLSDQHQVGTTEEGDQCDG